MKDPDQVAQTASLATALRAEAERFSAQADSASVRAMTDLVDDLGHSDLIARALKVGEPAPDFELPGSTGEKVRLAELLKHGPVILTWYRGGWCPYCNLQLHHLQAHLPRFEAAGATLVGLSPELPVKSVATGQRHQLGFPLLTDRNNSVAKKYGGVHRLNDGAKGYYGRMGVMDYYHE